MRIVRPYAKAVPKLTPEMGIEMMKKIESVARISHRSEERMGDDTWKRFIGAVVMQHGDWSVTEHIIVGVEFCIDRGISHELVRHRIGSYTQESTRFVNYEKHMPPSFIYPRPQDLQPCERCNRGEDFIYNPYLVHSLPFHQLPETPCTANYEDDWLHAIAIAEIQYRVLLQKGWAPQEARSVFPTGLATKIYVTYNLRTWRWFFIMRTTKEAHPQMREVTIPLLEEFQNNIPILFDDITPENKQANNLRLPK